MRFFIALSVGVALAQTGTYRDKARRHSRRYHPTDADTRLFMHIHDRVPGPAR